MSSAWSWATLLAAVGCGLVAGAVLYLLGAIGVTRAANVPLNDRLEKVDANDADGEWDRYRGAWTAWNHVRGALSGAAAALLTIALASE